MKSLSIIQKIAKIGRVINKLVFWFAIVGASLCLLGTVCLIVMRVASYEWFGEIFNEELTFDDALASTIVGFVLCLEQFFITRRVGKYLEHELKEGNPFTKELAKEMRMVGLIVIIVSLVLNVTCGIGLAIAKGVGANIGEMSLSNEGTLYFGLAFIVASLLCDYGAELRKDSSSEKEVIDVSKDK